MLKKENLNFLYCLQISLLIKIFNKLDCNRFKKTLKKIILNYTVVTLGKEQIYDLSIINDYNNEIFTEIINKCNGYNTLIDEFADYILE